MVLIVADDIGERLELYDFLKKRGIISRAPFSAETADVVEAERFAAVVFCSKIRRDILALLSPNTLCICAAVASEACEPGMICFPELLSDELVDLLTDVEGIRLPLRRGEVCRREDGIYQSGYPLKLRAGERIMLGYLMEREAASASELEAVCSCGRHRKSASDYVSAIVSRINRNAMHVGGRRIIDFDGENYRITV